jgi:hypothetical protein
MAGFLDDRHPHTGRAPDVAALVTHIDLRAKNYIDVFLQLAERLAA